MNDTYEKICTLKNNLEDSYDALLEVLQSIASDSDYVNEGVDDLHDILKQLNQIKHKIKEF